MKVIITGTSQGIGKSTALKFLKEGFEVFGIDIKSSSISHKNYKHYEADVSKKETLPQISECDIVVCNAGSNEEEDSFKVNCEGVFNTVEKYVLNNIDIKSVLFVGSQSGINGNEFPRYSASKGAIIPYMKWLSRRIACRKATCNILSPGPVVTEFNQHILEDEKLYKDVAEENLLKSWSTSEEIAEWIYFLTVVNKSATGVDFLVDCGGNNNFNFIW